MGWLRRSCQRAATRRLAREHAKPFAKQPVIAFVVTRHDNKMRDLAFICRGDGETPPPAVADGLPFLRFAELPSGALSIIILKLDE